MTFARISIMALLSFGCSSLILYVHGQSSDSFRIPSNGDSCNVINLNFRREEDAIEQARGPQGPPGKRGITGLNGPQGDKGEKGSVGPRGITPEVDAATVTAAVFKAIGATSCEELMNNHSMSESGFYLMRSNETIHPVYTYCDFHVRPELSNCSQLRQSLGEEVETGYYLVTEEDSKQTRFILCTKANDCKDVSVSEAKIKTKTGGVFLIIIGEKVEEVFCDLETDGGGWTVFQRRFDGSVDFARNWTYYVNGFGKLDGEFWMGLDRLHQLISVGKYELRIDLEDWEGSRRFAKYSTFSIAGASEKYKLRVAGYTGDANDSLGQHDDTFFSAPDVDNDISSDHCGKLYQGGWWFVKVCLYSHLNGKYHDPSQGSIKRWQGIIWEHWKEAVPLKSTEMKFRRKQ